MPDFVLVYVGIAAMLLRRDSVLVMAFFAGSCHGPCGNIDGRRVRWALYAYRISYEPGGGFLRQRYAWRFACYFYGVLSSGGSALCRFLYFVGLMCRSSKRIWPTCASLRALRLRGGPYRAAYYDAHVCGGSAFSQGANFLDRSSSLRVSHGLRYHGRACRYRRCRRGAFRFL